jgi:hypothetical protein
MLLIWHKSYLKYSDGQIFFTMVGCNVTFHYACCDTILLYSPKTDKKGNTKINYRHRLTQMKNYKWGEITEKIIGAAYKVHNTPGSGFLEKVYQNSLDKNKSAQSV